MEIDEKVPALFASESDGDKSDDLWAEYASGGNPFMYNEDGISRRMKTMRKKLFSSEEKMQIDFMDVVKSKFSSGS